MNPDLPDPIFLPPLHFSNERAYDRRKSSLPSIHGDLAFVSRRKLSLPWKTEEIVSGKPDNSSSISSGIRISARNLTPLPSASSDGFDNSTPKSEVYSLPGQLCQDTSESASATGSISSRSRSATVPSARLSLKPHTKDDNDKTKWQGIIDGLKKDNSDDLKSRKAVTEQPKLTANQLLPLTSGSSFPMDLVRKIPSILSGNHDPMSTFPRLSSDSVAPKDINVNMRHTSTERREETDDSYFKEHRSSRTTLLPSNENAEKREVTCPHCGEKFQPPPSESKASGCTGTLSTICTYAAMAGVVLVGCVHWAQNGGTAGSQLPGGELRSFLPSRRAR